MTGMKIMMGDQLGDMLMRMSTPCRKCGNTLVFEKAGGQARELGIKDQVVVCDKCWSAFNVNVGLGHYSLTFDVSDRYASLLEPAREKALASEERLRKEEEHRESIQAARRSAKQCTMCGAPLGRLDRFLRREQHPSCYAFEG
jgi:DNA-directed RNA polymerase subunit M/transcription elongation factor TFIIS